MREEEEKQEEEEEASVYQQNITKYVDGQTNNIGTQILLVGGGIGIYGLQKVLSTKEHDSVRLSLLRGPSLLQLLAPFMRFTTAVC